MFIVSAKDLMPVNGGVFYATNRLVSKFNLNDVNNLYVKNNTEMHLFKRSNIKKEEDNIVVTFVDNNKRKIIFVVPKS
ncbi:MAG: hypothetical protein NZZ41_03100 [Candidatus Dojkabacteria bacterium]|nr:hypothetical protein [Candidatus Dojkabacteria bacterium]